MIVENMENAIVKRHSQIRECILLAGNRDMNKDILRQILVVVATVFTITINGIVEALPLNGVTSAEVSASVQTLFTPPGYVFGIWTLIYIGLVAYAIYQALPAHRDNPRLKAIAPYYLVSAIANGLWLVLFHYYMWLGTVLVMLILLGSLIMVYIKLRARDDFITLGERWFVHVPFSIYLGWISVATIANIVIVLSVFGVSIAPFGPAEWTSALIIIGGLLGLTLSLLTGDSVLPLVFVWAFIGIGTIQTGIIINAMVVACILLISGAVLALLPFTPTFFRQKAA